MSRPRSILACLVLLLSACAPASAGASVPDGFRDTEIASFDGAMALAFTPDGRLLIGGRTGWLKVYTRDHLDPHLALDLKGRVCWDAERGMTGIAVDPDFEANHHIYLYYTYDKHRTAGGHGTCAKKSPLTPVNRVSRFTLGASDVVDPRSERVLIDNIPSYSGNHNAGDLGFGRDGLLYVSVGDGGCDYARDSGCFDQNDASRDRNVLLGKILRITRTGGIPRSNPFRGSKAASCARTGRTDPGKTCAETYAMGLRNPFRFAFDPSARGTRFFINDTGEQAWEEIDLGRPGADYGWNLREGPCRTNTSDCGTTPAGLTNPVFAYPHKHGCGAISGGAFVPPGVWPAAYRGGYLYGDYRCGEIRLWKPGSSDSTGFASGGDPLIDMIFGPYGSGQALYYTTWKIQGDHWEVHRVTAGHPRTSGGHRTICGGGIGATLILLGLCSAPYLRRRLLARRPEAG